MSEPQPILSDLEKMVGEYQTFIREIFRRLNAVSKSLEELLDQPSHPNSWQNADFCWFQMRKICEYLALGIVLAHHRETTSVEDLTKWRPKDLLAQVNKLSNHPTPVPIKIVQSEEGGRQITPLSKPIQASVVSAIYGKCSELLHVGSLDRILNDKFPAYDSSQLQSWLAGFYGLLREHVLLLPNLNRALLCVPSDENINIFLLDGDGDAFFNTDELLPCELLNA